MRRRGAARGEQWFLRGLLLALLGALTLLLLDIRAARLAAGPAFIPAALGALSLLTGAWVWRAWRGEQAGRTHLLLGLLGALAALVLARVSVGGAPGRLWIASWFLLPAVLFETTLVTIHGNGARSLPSSWRAALFGAPLLLYAFLPFIDARLPASVSDARAATALLVAGLLGGLARALASLRQSRAIDARQRSKLLAAGEAFALLSFLAALPGLSLGRPLLALPILGLCAAPLVLGVAAVEGNLLWVDRYLRRALAICVAVPPAAALAWTAVRWGGVPGAALAMMLALGAPAAWRHLEAAVERLTARTRARRLRLLGDLVNRLREASLPREVAAAARAVYEEAFPGVRVSLMIPEPGRGGFFEPLPPGEDPPRRTLVSDHPIAVHMRASVAPLTRYEILAGSCFEQNRGAWLRDIDDLHAAALIACRDGDDLRGILVLGGQVRGGFFTEDEVRDAAAAALPIGPALSETLALAQAQSRISRLESALEAARAEAGRVREEESRAMEDLEESTRHVMVAYTELKIRGMEAREVRARLASSAGIILAGRVLAAAVEPIAAALAGGSGRGEARKAPRRAGKGEAVRDRLAGARLGLEAISAVARKDPETPSDVARAVESAMAALEPGWRGRISVDWKIEGVPEVAWPRGALQAAILALLVNAAEAIEKRGTITVSGRPLEGRVMTVGDAEQAPEGEEPAVQVTPGQIAWMSGAPHVELTISDNGCGIPEEDHEKLFTPFFTTKPARPGSLGLGLSIVADALARHGGSIRVESDPGKGSSFVLELPGTLPKGRPGRAKFPS